MTTFLHSQQLGEGEGRAGTGEYPLLEVRKITSCLHCQQPGTGEEEGTGQHPLLEKLLPEGYVHLVCSYEEVAPAQFRAHFKLQITTEDEAFKWLEYFQTSSGQTWRKSKTYPNCGRYNAYRVDLRCQHNTYPRPVVKKTKNMSCGATMYLVLKRNACSHNRKSRSGDPHIKDGYLLNVYLRYEHNHQLSSTDSVRKRDVSDETIAKLKTLFERGHSPSTALDVIKYDLQERESPIYTAADRSICPDMYFCYRLYYKLFQKAYTTPSEQKMLLDLKDKIYQYNMVQGETCAKMEKTECGQAAVAICTPVMKRVHTKLRESGEIIFVDSSGHCESRNHRIFLLLAHSTVGGLPLGVLITTSESQSAITSGLRLLRTLLPSSSFFGREQPQVIMTNDCKALRQSLQAVFPGARLLLCMFHQLQAVWRWLWTGHNSVYRRHEEWAICLHNEIPTRGQNTNSLVESAFRVGKEKVLHRLKPYNVTQLVDFVTTRMDAHYIHCLTDTTNNRVSFLHVNDVTDVDCEKIVQVDENQYVVPNATSALQYDVDIAIGCCTCSDGITGALCKHQSAVLNKFGHHESVPHVPTPQMRKLYHEIATGSEGVLSKASDCTNLNASPGPGTSAEALEEMLEQFCRSLKDKLHNDPQTFTAPICNFLGTYKKMNDSSLTSALHCFGKMSQGKSKNRQSSKMNGTAIGTLQEIQRGFFTITFVNQFLLKHLTEEERSPGCGFESLYRRLQETETSVQGCGLIILLSHFPPLPHWDLLLFLIAAVTAVLPFGCSYLLLIVLFLRVQFVRVRQGAGVKLVFAVIGQVRHHLILLLRVRLVAVLLAGLPPGCLRLQPLLPVLGFHFAAVLVLVKLLVLALQPLPGLLHVDTRNPLLFFLVRCRCPLDWRPQLHGLAFFAESHLVLGGFFGTFLARCQTEDVLFFDCQQVQVSQIILILVLIYTQETNLGLLHLCFITTFLVPAQIFRLRARTFLRRSVSFQPGLKVPQLFIFLRMPLLSLAIFLSPLCLGFTEEAHPRSHGEAQGDRVLLNLELKDVKHLFVLHQVDGAQVGDKTPLSSLLLLLLLGQEGLQLLLNTLHF
ncbi:hypothetical protein FQN60_013263, partial [Etheostoma spectabile]